MFYQTAEKKSPSTLSPSSSSQDSFDVISTNKLTPMTSGRAKPPKRRPPSQHFLKENVSNINPFEFYLKYMIFKNFTKILL